MRKEDDVMRKKLLQCVVFCYGFEDLFRKPFLVIFILLFAVTDARSDSFGAQEKTSFFFTFNKLHHLKKTHEMKALRRCRNLEAENVVLIDVDTYNFNNVIDIDLLETLRKKQGGGTSGLTNDKNAPIKTYIYIDDDEIPNDTNFQNVASSSKRYDSDTHIDQENISPVKLSKGKRTYGLSTQSSSSSSSSDDDDEDLDCDLMEDDLSGKLREQWERAYHKRKSEEEKRKKSQIGNDNDNDDDDDLPGGREDERPCSSSSNEEEEISEKNDVVNDSISDDVSVEDSIIDQREKLKETEEYKRALEEELSARQIALKIQAEEAQNARRLAKRKKAESMRLLDMERRQKLRVEEIRETQKKDEENMNLKEEYRTEVRKELQKLEVMCGDMASLLRGLGIQVGDSSCPLPHEVRAAYKRALLSFHPDRACASDMRQQVEAEEKFKLISRMKDKYSL
ncbi:hypothetical protein LXL04_023592 [Taraxacum kok-saghyz]